MILNLVIYTILKVAYPQQRGPPRRQIKSANGVSLFVHVTLVLSKSKCSYFVVFICAIKWVLSLSGPSGRFKILSHKRKSATVDVTLSLHSPAINKMMLTMAFHQSKLRCPNPSRVPTFFIYCIHYVYVSWWRALQARWQGCKEEMTATVEISIPSSPTINQNWSLLHLVLWKKKTETGLQTEIWNDEGTCQRLDDFEIQASMFWWQET